MRRLESYVRRYGPDYGPAYYHLLQSHAAHAGVSARLRRKLDVLTGKVPPPVRATEEPLPLFDEAGRAAEAPETAELEPVGA